MLLDPTRKHISCNVRNREFSKRCDQTYVQVKSSQKATKLHKPFNCTADGDIHPIIKPKYAI